MKRGAIPFLRMAPAAVLAGGLLATAPMHAQTDRSRPPAPGPAPRVAMRAHTSFDLPNGMHVIVVPDHKLPLVGVQVRMDVPPVAIDGKAGCADLVGELLASGTTKRTKARIDEEVDRLGATLQTGNEGLYASALKKNLPALLDVLGDVVTDPVFPEKEFEAAMGRHQSSVQQRKDDPDGIAETVGRAVTFGTSHPYGEVTTAKSLQTIQAGHVRAYHARFFRPDKAILVFVGDVTEKEARTLAEKHFGAWKPRAAGATAKPDGSEEVEGLGTVRTLAAPGVPTGTRRVFVVDRPGAAQSVVRVCFPLDLRPGNPLALDAQVMNTILGGGVFNARLMQNLREDKGWTYGAYSSLEQDRFNGSFSVGVSVRTEVTDSAVREIVRELERMREEPVTREELELARSHMAGSFARSLEDPRTVARFAVNIRLGNLPKDHYTTYLRRLEAVTVEGLREAARTFLHPDKAAVLVVGEKKAMEGKLPAIGLGHGNPVQELDENGEPRRGPLAAGDKTAGQVIEDYLRAIGGREAIGRIKELRMELGTSVGGMDITITNWYGPSGRFRSETTAGPMPLAEVVYDGTRAVQRSQQGEAEVTGNELEQLRASARPLPEAQPVASGERLELEGIVEVEGRKAYKVVRTTAAGSASTEYYDTETFLKLRREEKRSVQGQTIGMTTDYADHQPAGGVLFPRTMRQSGGPMGGMTVTVKAIAVNEATKPGHFDTGLPSSEEKEKPKKKEGKERK